MMVMIHADDGVDIDDNGDVNGDKNSDNSSWSWSLFYAI